MFKKYNIEISDKNCIAMTKQRNTMVVYKLPYKLLKDKSYDIEIANNFIVYILFGHSDIGKDYIYVGKSKNGLFNRPTSHEGKYKNWEDCYVLTDVKEHTFFNDGVILFLEDKLRRRIDSVGRFVNTTDLTTLGTVNANEEVICLEYLEDAYVMLYTLGLDLLNKNVVSNNFISSQPSIIVSKKDIPQIKDIMTKPIFYCRIGWMKNYQGIENDEIVNGGSYNLNNIGHEVYNFYEEKDGFYGFIQNSQNHIEKLGVSRQDSFVENVLVVWVATEPGIGQKIVGWYPNAKVYRSMQSVSKDILNDRENRKCVYKEYSVFSKESVLIPEDKRSFIVKGMGQSNVYYGNVDLDKQVREYIRDYIN